MNCARVRGHRGHFSAWRLYFIATLKRPYFLSFSPKCVCVRARIIDQGLMCLIRSIDSNMADLGLHITLLPISRQALPSSAATCQNQLLVLQIGLCLFLYVFPVFEHLSVLFCSVLLFLALNLPPPQTTDRDSRNKLRATTTFIPRPPVSPSPPPCVPGPAPAALAPCHSGKRAKACSAGLAE